MQFQFVGDTSFLVLFSPFVLWSFRYFITFLVVNNHTLHLNTMNTVHMHIVGRQKEIRTWYIEREQHSDRRERWRSPHVHHFTVSGQCRGGAHCLPRQCHGMPGMSWQPTTFSTVYRGTIAAASPAASATATLKARHGNSHCNNHGNAHGISRQHPLQ